MAKFWYPSVRELNRMICVFLTFYGIMTLTLTSLWLVPNVYLAPGV